MPALHPFSHILEPHESSTRRRKQTAIAISSCKFFIVHHLSSTQLTMENSQTSVAREVLTIRLHCQGSHGSESAGIRTGRQGWGRGDPALSCGIRRADDALETDRRKPSLGGQSRSETLPTPMSISVKSESQAGKCDHRSQHRDLVKPTECLWGSGRGWGRGEEL